MSGGWLTAQPTDSRPIRTSAVSAPPLAPRSMAEWEEVSHLILAWTQYAPVLREIVRHAQRECRVLIVCQDASKVRGYLESVDIPLHNVGFFEHAFNSVWMRDYGPQSIYLNEVDSLVLVDWRYNRPRPMDDRLPRALAWHLGLPLLTMDQAPYDLVHIGGNFITDGQGTAFSSQLVVEENAPHARFNQTARDEAGIDSLMAQFLGIHRYHKLAALPYDPIDHLDMHMKLLNERTLLVGEYPPGIADGPQIEENLHHLQASVSTPYEVLRMPMPAFQGRYPDSGQSPYLTYTNAVFVNRTLLVPIYDLPSDSLALALYREALPGYRVVGIDCRPIITAGGALHCVTRTIGVRDPLRILHQPLEDEAVNGLPIQVHAQIAHKSGIAQAYLYYRQHPHEPFSSVPMLSSLTDAQTWVGYLPAVHEPATIQYYIEAVAHSGKRMTRPMPAPKGTWQFRLLPRNSADLFRQLSATHPGW